MIQCESHRAIRPPYPCLRGCLITTLFFGLAGCQSPTTNSKVEYQSEPWKYNGVQGVKLTTFHYILHSTYRRKPFVQALPAFLETCYRAYTKLMPNASSPKGAMNAYLFKRRRDWERFTEDFSPRKANTYKRIRRGGYSERGITVTHYSTQRSTLSILAHEGLHQYIEQTGRHPIPAWINEGLACYFESFDLVNNQPVFDPRNNNLRRPALRRALASDSLLPMREILATNAGVAIHQKRKQIGTYYAQEWSLILFLLHDPKENPYYVKFHRLLDDLGSDAIKRKAKAYLAADTEGTMSRGEALFRAYITNDLETFERDYRAFVRKLLDLDNF